MIPKRCKRCNKLFVKNWKKQIYCSACALKVYYENQRKERQKKSKPNTTKSINAL